MVKKNSLNTQEDSISFVVTDFTQEIYVTYSGSIPNLFSEGRGVVAEGAADHVGAAADVAQPCAAPAGVVLDEAIANGRARLQHDDPPAAWLEAEHRIGHEFAAAFARR